MAMNPCDTTDGRMPRINVTPMADVIIVLLIIFMVVTPLMDTSPVPLPAAASASPREADPLEVVVTATGAIAVGERSFADVEALGAFVQQRLANSGVAPSLLVQAHRQASYASVASVLDTCRRAGFEEVGLAAVPMLHGRR